jgi:hypothetical protein
MSAEVRNGAQVADNAPNTQRAIGQTGLLLQRGLAHAIQLAVFPSWSSIFSHGPTMTNPSAGSDHTPHTKQTSFDEAGSSRVSSWRTGNRQLAF